MSFGEVLWTLLIFYAIFFYFMILFRIFGDLFGDPDAGGLEKTGWIIFLLILPFISLIVYMIVRGRGMAERMAEHARAGNEAQEAYIRRVATTGNEPISQIAKGQELLKSGAITQMEFDTLKAKALA